MDIDDYENIPEGGALIHMLAGSVAGVMEHCVMYPVDSVKTRMQSLLPAQNASYTGVREALIRIARQEGLFRSMRGVGAVITGAGPAHAMLFASYEKLKYLMSSEKNQFQHTIIAPGVAGCVATLLHDGVMTPADVVKQRMQMYSSPYRSCFDCVRNTYRTEGIPAFYRSYTTQITMNIPFHSIHFICYEFLQSITNKKRTYNPLAHMISGAFAGAFAAAFTTPLDVCKTLLNTQEANALAVTRQAKVSGLIDAVRTIYQIRGVRGYFQGVQARVLYQMPSTAVCWSVYELFKYLITKYSHDLQCSSNDCEIKQDKKQDIRSSRTEPTGHMFVESGRVFCEDRGTDYADRRGTVSNSTLSQMPEFPLASPHAYYGNLSFAAAHRGPLPKQDMLLDMRTISHR